MLNGVYFELRFAAPSLTHSRGGCLLDDLRYVHTYSDGLADLSDSRVVQGDTFVQAHTYSPEVVHEIDTVRKVLYPWVSTYKEEACILLVVREGTVKPPISPWELYFIQPLNRATGYNKQIDVQM